ncbi:MAG: helix-turn-helix domain-containing protein [Pseudonocardiaceae bacterium]
MDSDMDGTGEQAEHKIGPELRRLRTEQGLSLTELGERAHYTKGYLSKIETGKKPFTPELARCLDEALETGGVLAGLLPLPERPVPADDEPTGTEVCPYPGLAAFSPDQSRWFFGRDRAINDLVSQLDDRLAEGGLLAVVAPSGAGKSSLLAAGLIPALARGALPGSRDWPVVATTPGAHPLAALAARVAERTGAEQAEQAAGDPDQFVTLLAEAVARHAGKLGETSSSAPVVLIVDQFEEIFTECHIEAERQAFITALGAAARGGVALVVLGVRADFFGPCLAYPVLLTALHSPVALGPMNAHQLREIIIEPAKAEGLRLEPGLVELLLRDLGVAEDAGAAGYDPGALPLLAHALRATWRGREGQTLTVAGYRRTGGIHQALDTTAEGAYTQLSPAQRQLARQVLLRLVNVSDQGGPGDTRRRRTRARLVTALPGSVDRVLEVFGRARLLTFDTTSVEITHEALLRAWPRLRQWIDTDRAGNLIRQELDDAAAVWDREGRDTAGLYRGNRLEAARTWAASRSSEGDLSPAAAEFLAASTQQEHSAASLRRAVLVVLSVLALVASGAAAVAFHQTASARSERDTAIFNQLTAQADRLRGTDVSLAAQLDLTAYRMRPENQDRYTALITDADAILSTPLEGHRSTVRAVAFSPAGRILASGGDDGTVRLWNVSDSTHPRPLGQPLLGHTTKVNAVAFSRDGRILASGGESQPVQLWNMANPAHPTPLSPPLTDHTNTVFAVAFSPDGRILASGGDNGEVRLWNLADPAHPTPLGPPLTGNTRAVNAVAFSPDGRILASGSDDRVIRLWNVADPTHPTVLGQPLPGFHRHVNAVVFSPDGRILASGGNDQAVRLWNVTDPAHPTALGPPLADSTNYVNTVAFNPDGHILAVGSDDAKVRLWNVRDPIHPMLLGPPLAGHGSYANAVAFSPDGRTIASVSSDRVIRLWNIPAALITGHSRSVSSVAFNSHGNTLATAGTDGTIQLWDVSAPSSPRPLSQLLSGHPEPVRAVRFSPDGRTLASGGDDHSVRLWNVTDPIHPTLLGELSPGHTGSVRAVAFSPDGRTLATGGHDHTVRLWNVSDPTRPASLGQLPSNDADSVNTVAFSPDGHTLASGGDNPMVRLWDVTDPTHPTSLGQLPPGHTNAVNAVVFSPDGRTLATGSRDHTTRLWNVTDPTHPASLGQLPSNDADSVNTLAFSPDGHTLATGTRDQTVRLWTVTDPAHPLPLGRPLTGHTSFVNALAFSPDGHTLASGSEDHTVRLWELNVDQAIRRICAITTNTLTPATWERYAYPPTLPYHPPCPSAAR